ncbi:response regulator [Desulfovibrio sp. SGI.169]|uniref:response regulator n=1 Tax=Desulfovibrio sp. SGI.169 TaxID=3420561 RepID=UPI003D06DE24
MAYLLSGTARLRVLPVVFLLCALCLGWSGDPQARAMLPATPGAPSAPLLPYLDYLLDETGTLDVEEAAAADKAGEYRPLALKALPRASGVVWLRFTLAPLTGDARPATLLLDMGESVPGMPLLYEPVVNSLSGAPEWRESAPAQRNVLLLPEADKEAQTCYIRLDGLPGLWFAPMMRTPQNAAGNWGGLSSTAASLALGVVMLLCLLRGLSEKGQWRVWTALYVAVALAQGIMGMPASGSGHIGLGQLGAVLAPGMALMLLPHVGRHLMRTRERSRVLDIQLLLLSLPGAALALLPLLPDFAWLTRYLDLWPLGALIFVPTALGAWIMGLGGAKRFLLGCLLPPLFVACGILGLDSGIADANLLASTPLWGTALSALLIAATRAPHDMAAEQPDADTAVEKTQAGPDDAITLDQPLDDPNLRLAPPAMPASVPPSAPDGAEDARANAPSPLPESLAPNPLENALRSPLDRLMREGAALGHCSLPPAVRQYAENMLDAAREMADIISNPRQSERQDGATEGVAPFNLQHLMREAHDAVAPAAESAGIGLAWYMPPHLGHMYEGAGATLKETLCLLLESAVRATRHGAVHFSARRVPESADAGHLLFTVTDSGSGMPPQDRSSLALTRAWELAGAHKGFLGVECSPHGAAIAFTLHLKCLEADESEAAPDARGQALVLVAAENALDRQTLTRMLANLPCRSAEARSLAEALQLHRAEAALLLVAQGRLASPLAGDMLRQFRAAADEAGLPLFKALAVTEDDSQWDQLADAGFTHALVEPVDGEALCQTVREILEAASAEGRFHAEDARASAAGARQSDAEKTSPARDVVAADASQAAAGAAGRPPLPDLFGSDDKHGASPLKIPNLTALPDLLSFAESLRDPLPGAGSGGKERKAEDGPSSGLPESGTSLPAMDPPPAEAAPAPGRGQDAPPTAAPMPEDGPADSPAPDAPADEQPDAAAEALECGGADAASDIADVAAREEFSAVAGLEGPVWSGEDPAETADAVSDHAASARGKRAEKPEENHAEAASAAVAETVRDEAESAPQAESKAVADTPAFAAEEGAFMAGVDESGESLPLVASEAMEATTAAADETSAPNPAPAQAATPEAPEESTPAEAPRKTAFQPVGFAARPGATIVPVRAKNAPAPEARANATAGAAVYTSPSLNAPGEWVGEPMPIGSPLAGRRQERDREAAPRMESPFRRNGSHDAPKSVYTSPGLRAPGEWVGEPMPIPPKPAPAPSSPVTREAQTTPLSRPEPPDTPAAAPSANDDAALEERASGNSIMDFIAGAEPVKKDAPSLATLVAEVSGPARPATPVPAPPPAEPANAAPAAFASAPDSASAPRVSQAAPDETILRLVERLDAAMEDAQRAFQSRHGSLVGEAAGRIAAESDAFGFRVLARMARCVEQAAKANDMNALKDLLPELAVAVERNRIALTPRR